MDGRMGEITEMRDVLIHVYFRADVRLTYKTATRDIPEIFILQNFIA